MDSVLVAQVIVNVLDNALKYSPTGGVIEVAARLREKELEIEVTDQGPGIPEEHLTQIFDKFFRITRADGTSGTGLGLAISKGIVDAHGGKIWAENRPGGGSKIVLTLPLMISGTETKSQTDGNI
jgi:two-component system sensor histidine kinase KdpD